MIDHCSQAGSEKPNTKRLYRFCCNLTLLLKQEENGAEMRPASVSGIVTGKILISNWLIYHLHISHNTPCLPSVNFA